MHTTDLAVIETALAGLAPAGRVAVFGRGRFMLRDIAVLPARGCDFEIVGTQRRRMGEERTTRSMRLAVAKVLDLRKGRLVLQDVFGSVFTLRPAEYGWGGE